MPNYSWGADVFPQIADAMRQYREGNPSGAQGIIKQINEMMDAYETQQRASYQSAQAYRTQQLAGQEAELFPSKKRLEEAKLNTENAQTDWTKQRAGISEVERTQKEREDQAIISGYNQWKMTNPDKTITDYVYETKVKPEQDYDKSRAESAGFTSNIDKVKSDLATGEVEAYKQLGTTPGAVEAQTAIEKMNKAREDAEISKIKSDYEERLIKAGLDKATKEAKDSDGLTINQWTTVTDRIERQIDTLNSRNTAIDRTIAYMDKSNNMDQLIQTMLGSANPEVMAVAGNISGAKDLETAKQALLANKAINEQRIADHKKRIAFLTKLSGLPIESIAPTESVVKVQPQNQDQQIIKGNTISLNASAWRKADPDTWKAFLDKQLAEGIKVVNIKDEATGKVLITYKYENGEWIQNMVGRKATQPQKQVPQTTPTPNKMTSTPTTQWDKDFQDAKNFFKKNQ